MTDAKMTPKEALDTLDEFIHGPTFYHRAEEALAVLRREVEKAEDCAFTKTQLREAEQVSPEEFMKTLGLDPMSVIERWKKEFSHD